MVLFQKCCCMSLKRGSTTICYFVLVQELSMLIFLIFSVNESQLNVGTPRRESKSSLYFHWWVKVLNVMAVVAGIYGVLKERPYLIIPFLAYRTVHLIFATLNLANLATVANTFSAEFTKADGNDRFDFLPALVAVAVLFAVGVELYSLLVVYSYYQLLIRNRNTITVDVPIVVYSPRTNQPLVYSQPAVNPYLLRPKTPRQYDKF